MVGSRSKVQGQSRSIAFAVLRQKHHNSFLPDHDEAMEEEIKEAIARSLALSGFKFSLKPEQFSCLSASLLGESVVAVLPTAFGKSLIYQLFPQAWSFLDRKRTGQDRPCTVLVLSPLVALMRDQVHRARKMGLTSAKLVASTASAVAWADSDPTTTAVTSSVTAGHYQLLFTSPEALLDSRNEECWTSLAESPCLRAMVVDEAHCILEW